ncbi:MAG: hypothetical protein IT176_03410 [Acidobacteria bacterium]|nr:hypothetical protein [Acidobacteriota bacterium]
MQQEDLRSERSAPLTLAGVLDVWRRRRGLGLAAAAAAIAAAATATLTLPDLYRATATAVIERQVSADLVKPAVSSELEARIQTIHQLVTSRERLGAMIETLHLYPALRGVETMDETVQRMRADITMVPKAIERPAGGVATISFAVSYVGRDARTVAMVANHLVEAYVEENAASRKEQAARTAEFLRQELDQVKQQLDDQERNARAFALQHADELPQQLEANIAALGRMNAELTQNSTRQAALLDRRERIEAAPLTPVAALPSLDTASPAVRLAALRQQLATARRSYNDAYPDVQRLTAEVSALEAEVAKLPKSSAPTPPILDPAAARQTNLEEVDTGLKALQNEERALRGRIGRYEEIVGATPRRQLEMDALVRSTDLARERYQALLKQYQDATLASALEQGQDLEQFRVLDPALPPAHPVAPQRLALALMGLAAAIAAGIAAMVLAEKLDSTFHAPDDLSDALGGLPVIALRRLSTRRTRRRARLRGALAAVAALLVIGLIAAGTYYVAGNNEELARMTARGAL